MTKTQRSNETHCSAIILLPSFNAYATAAFVDPLRAANYLDGKRLFNWQFFSKKGGPVNASNGMTLDTLPIDQLAQAPDWTVVSSSWTPEAHQHTSLLRLLKAHARSGVTLCGLDTGAFILGFTGLLDAHKATVHFTGQSAARYYLHIRLDRARGLITQTNMRIVQIAVACGFVSASHFSKAYKKKFELTPTQDRVAGRVPFEFRAFPMHARTAKVNADIKR